MPFTMVGQAGGREGDKEYRVGTGQGLQARPDSKVKEVIISSSFTASPSRPVNPTLWAEKMSLSTVS